MFMCKKDSTASCKFKPGEECGGCLEAVLIEETNRRIEAIKGVYSTFGLHLKGEVSSEGETDQIIKEPYDTFGLVVKRNAAPSGGFGRIKIRGKGTNQFTFKRNAAPPAEFKVGQRIHCKEQGTFTTIKSVRKNGVYLGEDGLFHNDKCLEAAPPVEFIAGQRVRAKTTGEIGNVSEVLKYSQYRVIFPSGTWIAASTTLEAAPFEPKFAVGQRVRCKTSGTTTVIKFAGKMGGYIDESGLRHSDKCLEATPPEPAQPQEHAKEAAPPEQVSFAVALEALIKDKRIKRPKWTFFLHRELNQEIRLKDMLTNDWVILP